MWRSSAVFIILENMEKTHTGKPHECKQYGNGYSDFTSLKTHKRSHIGEKLYECKTCRKVFSCLSYFRKHERTQERHDEGKQCVKAFHSLQGFQRHERNHTREKILKMWESFHFAHKLLNRSEHALF